MGNRAQASRRRRPAYHLLLPRWDLLAALCQRADADGQQHLQRQSPRRHLARQMRRGDPMRFKLRIAAVAVSALLVAISAAGTASAQKRGGTLRIYNPESIASLSMLEEFANAELPIMGMFNN